MAPLNSTPGQAMTVTDEYVAALRAFLTGDPAFSGLARHLEARDGDAGGTVYAALLAMTFTVAARRRFAGGYTTADVIRFVASARISPAGEAGIDPRAAERVLHAALDDAPAAHRVDAHARGLAITALLSAIVAEENLHGPALDELLAAARRLTDRALAQQSCPGGRP